MMLNLQDRETEYLLSLIRCAIKGDKAPDNTGVDMERLFTLAKKQQVYCLVLPCLEEANLLDKDQLKQWKNYKLSELKKTITVNSERELICADLDRAGIGYIFLKGLVIREYYPKTAMRQMSDNDLAYDKSRRDELIRIMKKHGYYLGASTDNSDDFYKKPYCTFEFHRELFNDKDDFCPDFSPWENSTPVEGSSRRVISREDNYLYTVAHLYKHYHCVSGAGVRFVVDLYLLTHSDDELDYAYINKTLEEFGITDFNALALGLADDIFEDKEPTSEELELLDFMFSGYIYGSEEYDIEGELDKYGSKSSFILHRLFPSKSFMFDTYKNLGKRPYLLPFYYVYRLFDKYRHNKEYMDRDLSQLKKIKK